MSDPAVCPHCHQPLPDSALGGLCPECMLRLGASHPTDWPDATAAGTGEAPPNPPAPEDIARHFPQFEILACLGRGGMGVVYKARQTKLNRLVALKVLAPERGADPKFAERFTREAQALARLSHPNIVAVHDFGEANGVFYLLMEYVEGRNLRDLLRTGEITPDHALAIVPPICEALQFAHEQGVVHRDIKPENVLVDSQGRVKIADFGVAKLVGKNHPPHPALTENRQVIGTPHYMAPEQVERPHLVDHRADIYSLGVVFYEMLTGELPLGRFPAPSSRVRGVQVDVRLDEVVLHALEKEPDRRYQKASEVRTDVERLATKTRPASPAQGAVPARDASHSTPPKCDRTLSFPTGRLAAVPGILWISIAWSVGLGLWQLFSAPTHPGWLVSLLLGLGLLARNRAAHALALYLMLWSLPLLLLNPSWANLAVVGFTALPSIPVLFSTSWFYPRHPDSGLRSGGDWAAGLLFATPPLIALWFLRGGHWALGLDLDADVQFFVGLFGLPFSGAVGALLLVLAQGWLGRFTSSTPPAAPNAPARSWSTWAIAAVLLLIVSLPLGGGGVVLMDLFGLETRWNPGPQELVMVLTLGVAAALTIAGSALLGWLALRRIQTQPSHSRGWTGAVAATWLWPCLLLAVLLTSWRRAEVTPTARTAVQAAAEARVEQLRQDARQQLEANRGFESVHEVVLRRGADLQGAFLDLDTGATLSAPADLVESLKTAGRLWPGGGVDVSAFPDWIRTNGVDVVCRDGDSGLTLVDGAGILMSKGRAGRGEFDIESARKAQQAADALNEALAIATSRQPQTVSLFWFDPQGGTNTWAIRTRSGRSGLLELRADRVQPDHIRFRYKLVAIPSRMPAPQPSPKPVPSATEPTPR